MCCNFQRTHRRLTMVSECFLALGGLLLLSLKCTMTEYIDTSGLELKEGSYTYDFWRSSPFTMYHSIYMFNLTNPDDVLMGKEPILKEVGPYVYRVQQNKTNITFNSNGTVTYKQNKTYHFVPEKSGKGLSLSDEFIHINMVLVAASAIIKKLDNKVDHGYIYLSINQLCKKKVIDCDLFRTHNVSDLLFDGYDDRIIFWGRILGINIPYNKFGFFNGRNATPGSDGIFNMFTGVKDINKLGFLANWNYSDHLGAYEPKSVCDRFSYSSAGDLWPPYQITDNSGPIYIFLGDIARSIRMEYQEDIVLKDIKGKRYAADQHLFDYSMKENQCFCMNISGKIKCPDNGIADVSASANGAPIFISHPHFLYAKSYQERVKGLFPDESKHGFYFDIDNALGKPMRANARIQINVLIERDENMDSLKNFPLRGLLLPQLWTDISIMTKRRVN